MERCELKLIGGICFEMKIAWRHWEIWGADGGGTAVDGMDAA